MTLVAMVTILSGKYRLPIYQYACIYKMEKCYLLTIATVVHSMSTELSSHQHSKLLLQLLYLLCGPS